MSITFLGANYQKNSDKQETFSKLGMPITACN